MLQLLKPVSLEPTLCNKRSHRNEKPVRCKEEQPRSPQLEKAHEQQGRPMEPEKKKKDSAAKPKSVSYHYFYLYSVLLMVLTICLNYLELFQENLATVFNSVPSSRTIRI